MSLLLPEDEPEIESGPPELAVATVRRRLPVALAQSDALTYMARAIDILTRRLGPNHPSTLHWAAQLAGR